MIVTPGRLARRSPSAPPRPALRFRHKRDPAANVLVHAHAQRPRGDGVHHVVRDARREALTERALVPERPQVVLERLGLEAALLRLILDLYGAEVRLPGAWADGGVLGRRERHALGVGGRKRLGLQGFPRFVGAPGLP